jgi:hypothetical protein
MVISDKIKYFLRKTSQNKTKNKFKIKKTGYARPAKAMSQNCAGEIYCDRYESKSRHTMIRLIITINLLANDIFLPLVVFPGFFFVAATYQNRF